MLQIPKMTQFDDITHAPKLVNNLNICLDVSQTKMYNIAKMKSSHPKDLQVKDSYMTN